MRRLKPYGFVFVLAVLAACGSEISKDGTPANSGANNTYRPPGTGMEQGASDESVRQAYSRIMPLLCAYDETCSERLFEEVCPVTDISGMVDLDQCWVVDNQKLNECENSLRGLQCEPNWANMPQICGEAVRQCECLDGFVEAWDDNDEMGCYAPCVDGACQGGLFCYDGACMPEQENRCADGQALVEVNGVPGCYDGCDNGECAAGFECRSGLCIAAMEPDPPMNSDGG